MTALAAVQRLGEALFGRGDLTIRSHGGLWVASYCAGDVARASGYGSSWTCAVEGLEGEIVRAARGRVDLAGLVREVEQSWEAA